MAEVWDVIIAGAGPAGTACAALLAKADLRVLVLEKESFPRFRIGESLLPACMAMLERLELEPQDDSHVIKWGADFICEETGRAQSFGFGEALPGVPPHAWHVERPLFDTQLRDRARAWGAEVRHECPVTAVAIETDVVQVTTPSGVESARYFLDATGQNRLLARRHGTVRHYERFGMAAAFTHFDQLGPVQREVFGEENNIRIMIRPEGWGWIIPLPNSRLSVGVASTSKLSREDLDEGLLAGPLMQKLSAGARRLDTHLVGNFSYENTAPRGARYAAVGDACAFLDPVFSSGVTLALRAAEGTADALIAGFEAQDEANPDLLAEHASSMDRAYRTFGALIERFYHTRFADSFFLSESPQSSMRCGIMSVLAGDVWRDDNPFQEMLLKGRTRETVRGGREGQAV